MKKTPQAHAAARTSMAQRSENKFEDRFYRLIRASLALYLTPALLLVLLVGSVLIALGWLGQRAIDLHRWFSRAFDRSPL